MLPSKNFLSLLYQFVDLALKSPMTAIREGLFCAKISIVITNLQQTYPSRFETVPTTISTSLLFTFLTIDMPASNFLECALKQAFDFNVQFIFNK